MKEKITALITILALAFLAVAVYMIVEVNLWIGITLFGVGTCLSASVSAYKEKKDGHDERTEG